MLLELLQYRAWALSESYFSRIYPVIEDAFSRGSFDRLIKKQSLKDYMPRVHALLNIEVGHPPVSGWHDELIVSYYEVDPATQKVRLASDPWTGETLIPTVKSNGKTIALLPVIGPVMKYAQACGPMGMQDIGNLLMVIEKCEEFHGGVMIMDTPGGTADGTPELGMIIAQMSKPIGVFGDGMVASAGMWLASQADVIVGNKNNPTAFGSIGTLMGKRDISNVVEAGNTPKIEIIRAPQSTEKALLNDVEPLTDELRAEIISQLRDITIDFIAAVKAGRGDKLDTKAEGLFAGRMFDVYKAKQIGLIDHVGNLQTAINKVVELTKQKASSNSNSNNSQMKFPKLSSLFGGTSKEAKEVTMKVTSEGLQSDDEASVTTAETKVAEMEAELTRLKADNGAKDQTLASLTATVSEQATQITNLEQSNTTIKAQLETAQAALKNAPTGSVVTVIPGKGEEAQSTDPKVVEKNKFRTSADDEADKYVEAMYPTSKP
jgi:ClpP class serine protease